MMACDVQVLANIKAMQPYQPGKPIEELERELGISNIIKLASNENPLGPAESVLEAVTAAAKELTRYPDGNGFTLKSALAAHYAIEANQITLGNGSNDVLELIARTVVSPADEVIFSQYAFAVYSLVTQAIGARAIIAPAKDYGHDLDAMSVRVTDNTRLIFIANPNNPTGSCLEQADIKAFLERIPDSVVVVLDEAYVEYNQPDTNSIDWLAEHPNLVITRTFSKAYGLASLRVGYSLSHPDMADMLNRIRQPFNVNSLALAAAKAALADQDYIARSQISNRVGMQQLITGLAELGLNVIPSSANFVTVDVKTAGQKVFQQLLQQGVITRPVDNYGLPQHLRISIGTEQENQRCLEALATIVTGTAMKQAGQAS